MKTSEEILHAALKTFADKGYEGTSLSTVASEVGIKKPSIYNHFKSKEDLFLAVVQFVYKEYLKEIKNLIDNNSNKTPDILLKLVVDNITTYLSSEKSGIFYIHFLLFPPKNLKEKINEQFSQFEKDSDDLFIPVFQNAIRLNLIKQVPIQDLLDSFYCLLDGITFQLFSYTRSTGLRKKEAAWQIFWNSISKKVV
ncbi:hypothetical protein CR203_16575 [Salipaludibacillus neizhouensis]|uniref:HTH tetR-type domain-containing protein n=1 Tax=Salipaludibacillus neizhouensis TaxID=885475 RepID=A0A3A9K755_9BACI|nr:TetR/AcrR family transcriptional regulator [Salipaludibacillus neizhouensis]RKL66171.1 hypothetical protein CR203_16575 [Salipaludibacillus neizhouensis]